MFKAYTSLMMETYLDHVALEKRASGSNDTYTPEESLANSTSDPEDLCVLYEQFKAKENVRIGRKVRQINVYTCLECVFSSPRVLCILCLLQSLNY